MSTTLYADRTARKRHRCERCRCWIEPGEVYTRAALPPHTEPNESDRWWTLTVHGRSVLACPPPELVP